VNERSCLKSARRAFFQRRGGRGSPGRGEWLCGTAGGRGPRSYTRARARETGRGCHPPFAARARQAFPVPPRARPRLSPCGAGLAAVGRTETPGFSPAPGVAYRTAGVPPSAHPTAAARAEARARPAATPMLGGSDAPPAWPRVADQDLQGPKPSRMSGMGGISVVLTSSYERQSLATNRPLHCRRVRCNLDSSDG
jgi:hypothetical protein